LQEKKKINGETQKQEIKKIVVQPQKEQEAPAVEKVKEE